MYAVLPFAALVLFLATENSFLHLSRNARRVFWYLFSCALTVWLVRWVGSLEGLSLAWVLLSATLAASVVEDEVSKRVGLTMLDIEATRRLRAALRSPEAQGKAERVMDVVSAISRGRGYTMGAKQLVGRMSGTTQRLQRALQRVLETAEADELNYLLCTVNCPAMLEVCSKATIDMLVTERLPDLRTPSRTAIVDALQKLGLRYRWTRQGWARDVLLNTRGLQLTYLKCYLDDGGDFHSTYKLMSHDLQGEFQAAVLEHFKAEGALVAAEFKRVGGGQGVLLKVVSDIDDTLFSSGGSWPAGVDSRYPKKCYYPGALALYTELDRYYAEKHARALARLAEAEAGAGISSLGGATGTTAEEEPALEPPLAQEGNGGDTELDGGDGEEGGEAPSRQSSSTLPASESSATLPIPVPLGKPPLSPTKPRAIKTRPAPPADGDDGGDDDSDATPPWPPQPPQQAGERLGLGGASASAGVAASMPTREAFGERENSLSFSHASSSAPDSSVGGSAWGASSAATAAAGSTLRPLGKSALTSSLTSGLRPLQVPGKPPSGALSAALGELPPSSPLSPLFGCAEALGVEEAGVAPSGVGAAHQEGSNLVFLSARPQSYKGLTEAEAYNKYFQPLVGRELHTAPSMLTGSLSSGPKALMDWLLGRMPEDIADNPRTAATALYQTLAAKKLSRFRDFAVAWPEAAFMLVGDNGQGDLLCAEILASEMRAKAVAGGGTAAHSRLLACLIHKVAPLRGTLSMSKSKDSDDSALQSVWRNKNIYFAKSHVGLAMQAHTLGLLDAQGLHTVCAAAIMDFRRTWARYAGRHAGRHLAKALEHLQADLQRAKFYLPTASPLPPLLISEAASMAVETQALPPPSPARSLMGTSPPGYSFHREYGWTPASGDGIRAR